MSVPYVLRPPTADDVGFMLHSWLTSAGEAWDKASVSDVDRWCGTGIQVGHFAELSRRLTRAAVAAILEREDCRAVVACDVEEPDVLFGFAVAEPSHRVVHWAYVKSDLRHNGIARAMVVSLMGERVAGQRVVVTYLPREFVRMQERYRGLSFDPWAGGAAQAPRTHTHRRRG